MSAARTAARKAVIALTNRQRKAAGLRPLVASVALTNAAQGHADDMSARHYFSHDSKDGTSWSARIGRHYQLSGRAVAENIAFGQRSPLAVVRAWMASPGHRRNILDPDLRRIGVGFQREGWLWVQDFGSD